VVSADRKQLLGAILVGDTSDYGPLLQVVLNGMPIPQQPEELILPLRAGGGKGLGVEMLPDSALVCSCNNVSKGAICQAVAEGSSSLGSLKKKPKRRQAVAAAGRSRSRSWMPS
jgi:nitrite reductase (NADH) large subunit